MKKHILPEAPSDYLPNDIIRNRNWKELGWPKPKMKAYQVYQFPQWIIKNKPSPKPKSNQNTPIVIPTSPSSS